MAPSATTEEVQFVLPTSSKVGVATAASEPEGEKTQKGGEGKTALEAISHGPLVHPGEEASIFISSHFVVVFNYVLMYFVHFVLASSHESRNTYLFRRCHPFHMKKVSIH